MKIYDLSKELFSATVFPGDPKPGKEPVLQISDTTPCNLTMLTMGSHNGTHMDAPLHFIRDGKGMAEVPLEKCVGTCKLVRLQGVISEEKAKQLVSGGVRRLLLAGEIEITPQAAQVFARALDLIGVESMTVGTAETGAAVHRTLLSAEVVILESLVLSSVPEGDYLLVSAPLKMEGLDGSPCRPVLLEL